MDERDELEQTLRSMDAGPRARVRDTILHSFDANVARHQSARRSRSVTVLRRLAAAAVLIVMFLAGRWSTQGPMSKPEPARHEGTELAVAMASSPASVDLLRVVDMVAGRPDAPNQIRGE